MNTVPETYLLKAIVVKADKAQHISLHEVNAQTNVHETTDLQTTNDDGQGLVNHLVARYPLNTAYERLEAILKQYDEDAYFPIEIVMFTRGSTLLGAIINTPALHPQFFNPIVFDCKLEFIKRLTQIIPAEAVQAKTVDLCQLVTSNQTIAFGCFNLVAYGNREHLQKWHKKLANGAPTL